jgi:hypothetical protein
MKLIRPRSLVGKLIWLALLAGAPILLLCSDAPARGGGGFHGGGSMSGGSLRAGGGWGAGPQGGVYGQTPQGGQVYHGPLGGGAVKTPQGGAVVKTPPGGEIKGRTVYPGPGYQGGAHMVKPPGNWGPYYGPGYGVTAGAAAGLAAGMVVGALPPGAVARTVGDQRYFFNGGVYYLPCYQGSDLAYCVVPDPNQ